MRGRSRSSQRRRSCERGQEAGKPRFSLLSSSVSRGGQLLAAMGLGGLLLACHPKTPVPVPVLTRQPPSFIQVQQVLAQQEVLESLSASFELVVQQERKKDRVQGALALVRAEDGLRLRLELYSPLGPPLAYAVLTPDEASIYLTYSRVVLYSPDPEGLLKQESGGRLDLAEVLGAMLGGPLPCEPREPVTFRAADDRFLVPCVEPGTGTPELKLLLSPEPLTLAGLETANGVRMGAPEDSPLGTTGAGATGEPFRVRFEERLGELPVPLRWSLEGEGVALELRLAKDELSVEGPLDAKLFRLELPENTQVASLEHWLQGLKRSRTPSPNP